MPAHDQPSHHNVILFGAGASFDAGIPLLNSFVDKMWEYGVRGKVGSKTISADDRRVLQDAIAICESLERYNSRAFFDIRNLEDILSLLSFEALRDETLHTERYSTMVKAVARTIELSCVFDYASEPPASPRSQTHYQEFWHSLFARPLRENLPVLLTFNYDLVLERTLWQYFHHQEQLGWRLNLDSCLLNYCFGSNRMCLKTAPHTYAENPDWGGTRAELVTATNYNSDAEIKYYKLHGSLNWSQDAAPQDAGGPPTKAVGRPLILPPVFNKMTMRDINIVWKNALTALRSAKHIILVGYSLPQTDIYMQYFLKAAVGPNSNLQRIIVFDPALFRDDDRSREMKRRYSECFSPQFGNRIDFRPLPHLYSSESAPRGTFQHFVHALRTEFTKLLFFP
jgi:hypothetical protein